VARVATEFDVAVLGGGMAGSAAAIAAASQGARVCILTGPPGASALFSGAWHGPVVDGVRDALSGVGYQLQASDHALALPHPNGSIMRANAAPVTHARARLDAGTVVVGIAGLPGYDAEALRMRWQCGAAQTVYLDRTPAAGWGTASLATWLERQPDALSEKLRAIDGRHLVLPAVLGMNIDGGLHAQLERDSGRSISEALSSVPSIPGWRLQIAIQLALRAAGVTVFEDKAKASRINGYAVEEVQLSNGDVVYARNFVLATGKFSSGGIEANGAFHEVTLGCPVWVDHLGQAFEEPDALMLTDVVRTEDQPLLRAGVHASDDGRPINRAGQVIYTNVSVAGSVRAGWTTGSHGIGHAARDGWTAGERASGGGRG
jgi:glycerol-3-phosphate dehydrogenase subunit B